VWKGYKKYITDWNNYSKLIKPYSIEFEDSLPKIFDSTYQSTFDSHYFYQAIWAFENIKYSSPTLHLDIGSDIKFVGLLSTIYPVIFLDYRPIKTSNTPGLRNLCGDILALPFANNSISSITCLHVIEHIGLGRYGEPLKNDGSIRAFHEISRIVKPGGFFYLSIPIGRERLQYNAHRILAPETVINVLDEFKLIEFSVITDTQEYRKGEMYQNYQNSSYACGLFVFQKDSRTV